MKNLDRDPGLGKDNGIFSSQPAQESEWVTAMDDMPSYEDHMATMNRENEFLGPAADVSSEEENSEAMDQSYGI